MKANLSVLLVALLLMLMSSIACNANDRYEVPSDWPPFSAALNQFESGGSHADLLRDCKKILLEHPDASNKTELQSLVRGLESESPPPYAVAKPADKRTQQDWINYWIYDLRNVQGIQMFQPGYPSIFHVPGDPMKGSSAADELVAIGKPALPALIATVNDYTPTRTIGFHRAFSPSRNVLRRQDIAMECIECITGCQFYAAARYMYKDVGARRTAAIKELKTWWQGNKYSNQAEGIRSRLAMRASASTRLSAEEMRSLYGGWGLEEVRELRLLAALEGPEAVVIRLNKLLESDTYGVNSPIAEAMAQFDPAYESQEALNRFRANKCRDGDMPLVCKYGNYEDYKTIAERIRTATNSLPTGSHKPFDTIWLSHLVEYGKEWSIPILALALDSTERRGARWLPNAGTVEFTDADDAIELLQKLTKMDFAYDPAASEPARMAAIARAREWWNKDGKTKFGNPPRDSHEAIAPPASYKVQRAWLNSLSTQKDPAEMRKTFTLLQHEPRLWFLPRLTQMLEHGAPESRIAAASTITLVLQHQAEYDWSTRVETIDTALSAARKIAADEKEPPGLRESALKAIRTWGSLQDAELIKKASVSSK